MEGEQAARICLGGDCPRCIYIDVLPSPAMSTRKYLRNLRRNRITRRSWQEFLRVEKRFGTFLNENDTSTCGTSFPRFLAGTQTKICVFTEYEIDCSDIPRLRDIHGRGETLFIR